MRLLRLQRRLVPQVLPVPDRNVKEFRSEIRIMRSNSHANIHRFIGAVTRAPHMCIVTELLEVLRFVGCLSAMRGGCAQRAMEYLDSISSLLHRLHDRNYRHSGLLKEGMSRPHSLSNTTCDNTYRLRCASTDERFAAE